MTVGRARLGAGTAFGRGAGPSCAVLSEDTDRDPRNSHQGRTKHRIGPTGVERREADPVEDGDGESNECQCLPFHDLSVPVTEAAEELFQQAVQRLKVRAHHVGVSVEILVTRIQLSNREDDLRAVRVGDHS